MSCPNLHWGELLLIALGVLAFVAVAQRLLVRRVREQHRPCPLCREWIHPHAHVCPRCRRDLPEGW